MQKINQYRSEIDNVDEEILRLLSERAKIALKIFEEKKTKGIPIYDSERESEIMKKIIDRNKGPIHNENLQQIYETILLACRKLAK